MSDLRAFVEQAAVQMRDEYRRIRSRSREDPGTAGDEAEENWAELLKRWLPAHYHVRTKGRVLHSSGEASTQVDVVVLYPEYPPGLLDRKIYLAHGVAAVFECKLTLRRQDIESTIRRAAAFQEQFGLRLGTPRSELFSPISYGLLAHSHEWQGQGAQPEENIHGALLAADRDHVDHPRKMLDVVCVADLGTWSALKTPLTQERVTPGSPSSQVFPHGFATTGFIERSERIEERHSGTNDGGTFDTAALAIGEALTALLTRIAYEDHSVRKIAWALRSGRFSRTGYAECRLWPVEVFSSPTLARLILPADATSVWDEWSRTWI